MNPVTRCKHLRTKSMFIPALAHELASNPDAQLNASAHYWCNCTATETGPDDGPVGLERCQQTRKCFEE